MTGDDTIFVQLSVIHINNGIFKNKMSSQIRAQSSRQQDIAKYRNINNDKHHANVATVDGKRLNVIFGSKSTTWFMLGHYSGLTEQSMLYTLDSIDM